MANETYHVEVKEDFLKGLIRAKPVSALSELIWNALDADANHVNVTFLYDLLDQLSSIVVSDNGSGIERDKVESLFGFLGGSWKKQSSRTKETNRFLHGKEGKGRYRAFALGSKVEWTTRFYNEESLLQYKISMTSSELTDFAVSEVEPASETQSKGTDVTVSQLNHDFRVFFTEIGIQELTETFALYMLNYPNVVIQVGEARLDPNQAIAHRETYPISVESADGDRADALLEIVEWNRGISRNMYLCSEQGMPLTTVDRRYHIGDFHFTAYLKSDFVSKLSEEGMLDLAEMNPVLKSIEDQAYLVLKDHFRKRLAEKSRNLVDRWKQDHVYPYEGEPQSAGETAERQIFDIVATKVTDHIVSFEDSSQKERAFQLKLLRTAIEAQPENLQKVLTEVLQLPKREIQSLASLLDNTSLTSMIHASREVTDRLKYLEGLEAVLFDQKSKKLLKERSQLHKIVEQTPWLFGEEYSLSASDKSLNVVLKKHLGLLGENVALDEPVGHINQTRGIIDLLLSRTIKTYKKNNISHLVVELKAPSVILGSAEISQIKGYAYTVAKDERFKGVGTTWTFWLVGDNYDTFAETDITDSLSGLIYDKDSITIYVRTWAQILEENRVRLQFFRDQLNYAASEGDAVAFLRERYGQFLEGVVLSEEGSVDDATPVLSDEPESP